MADPTRGDLPPSALVLSARRVGWGLALLVGALVVVGVTGQVYLRLTPDPGLEPLARRFNLDAESTIPAYVSSLLLLLSGVLLAVTARVTGAGWRSPWGGLSAVFVGLSMDEVLILHESLVEPVRSALDTSGALYFAWVIPGALFVAVLGALYVPFLLSRPPWLRRLLVLSGTIYVGGALGLEFVGGALTSAGLNESWGYFAVATVEETAELVGVSLFIYTLLLHLERRQARLDLRFGAAAHAR